MSMSFWKNLAQMAVRQFDPAEGGDCPNGPPGHDPAFATAVTALGAKLAISDGLAQWVEQRAFIDVFKPQDSALENVLRLYDLARQTSLGYESYAIRLAKRYAKCPQILEDVMEGLFHIAASDGRLSDAEETYLETVANLFGLKTASYRRIRAGYVEPDAHDPYVIFGLAPDASDAEIRRSWQNLIREFHPDTVLARGLPYDYIEIYTQKSARINAAYDTIMRERK
jgi:DnaJ like chaperone protein